MNNLEENLKKEDRRDFIKLCIMSIILTAVSCVLMYELYMATVTKVELKRLQQYNNSIQVEPYTSIYE